MIRALVLTLALAACARGGVEADARPNIVLVLADDLGWKDVSYNGSDYSTPHIDRLAAQGLTFTRAYAAAPSCSPTRAALLTGCAPARLGITRAILVRDYLATLDPEKSPKATGPKWPWPCLPYENATHLPAGVPTFADKLRAAGYETAFIGKWHLGLPDNGPAQHGFEHESFVGCVGAVPYFPPYPLEKTSPSPAGEYLTDRLTDEALAFLERDHARPFCLVLAHYAVHEPIQGKPELVREFEKKVVPGSAQGSARYAAMLCSLDESVGRIVDTLARRGLEQNTLLVFTSDNGPLLERGEPLTTVAPLRGGKLELYEGGLRVPLLMRWPGRFPAGESRATPVVSMDLYPTLLRAAGIDLAPGEVLDGVDLAPLFSRDEPLARDALRFFVPHREAQAAILAGGWKLIHWFGGKSELYDLTQDAGEQHDLAAREVERARALETELQTWIRSTGAALPELNPHYDPSRARARGDASEDE